MNNDYRNTNVSNLLLDIEQGNVDVLAMNLYRLNSLLTPREAITQAEYIINNYQNNNSINFTLSIIDEENNNG